LEARVRDLEQEVEQLKQEKGISWLQKLKAKLS
jgi:hypothetical protein